MKSYRHVILITDLSQSGINILLNAATNLKVGNSELSLVYLMDAIPPVAYGFTTVADVEQSLFTQYKQQLATLGTQFNIPVMNQYIFKSGNKSDMLKITSGQWADLIVLGLQVSNNLFTNLFSDTLSLIHRAKCDVLVTQN